MSSAWRALPVLLCALGLAVSGCDVGGTLDPKIPDLEKAVSDRVGEPVTITCPKIPLGTGKISDCVVTDGHVRKYLRITQDDDQGHYTWEVTDQDAP